MENPLKRITSENIIIFGSIATLVVVLFFKILLLSSPSVGFDDAGLGYMARSINAGSLPYLDVFDHKPFLNYYALALWFSLFGDSAQSMHVFAALLGISLLVIIFFVSKKLLGARSALIATAISSVFFFMNAPAMEIPMTLFGLIAVYFYLNFIEKDKPFILFFSGIFIGFSIWFKQPGILFLIGILIHQAWICRSGKDSQKHNILLKNTALLIIGILVISLPLLSFIVYSAGWSNFFYAVFTFNFLFSGSAGRLFSIGKLILLLVSMFGFLIPLVIFQPKKKKSLESFCLTFIGLMLLFFIVSQEIFEQHILQVIPFIAILAVHTYKHSSVSTKKIYAVLIILFFIVSTLSFLNAFVRTGKNASSIIEEIKTETGASNSIFADSPVIYFLGNYTNNYRFFYISSSVSSVFNLSDFCEFSNTQDYLILTYRKKFLGEDNLICIDNKFELKKRFEPIGDSFVELWKRK